MVFLGGAIAAPCCWVDDDDAAADAIMVANGMILRFGWGTDTAAAALEEGAVYSGSFALASMLAADDDDDDDPELPGSAAAELDDC